MVGVAVGGVGGVGVWCWRRRFWRVVVVVVLMVLMVFTFGLGPAVVFIVGAAMFYLGSVLYYIPVNMHIYVPGTHLGLVGVTCPTTFQVAFFLQLFRTVLLLYVLRPGPAGYARAAGTCIMYEERTPAAVLYSLFTLRQLRDF